MATGGEPFEEEIRGQGLPNWTESLEERLNNMDWGGQQKKANGSSEKNKKRFATSSETRLTNDISPESSPGIGRRRTKTPHTFPHTRYITQMSVPEQAELEKLRQRINFSDLDQRSIGSDSQGRATAANNKRQLGESKKAFNILPHQINTNKAKDAAKAQPKKEASESSQCKDFFASVLTKDAVPNFQVSVEEDGRGEPAVDSSQVVSKLVQIRDYITKAISMRDDLLQKNERSANIERLTTLIDHLKDQEKSYLKFLQKMLARENEDDVRTVDSAVGSGSVADTASLNADVHSEPSDTAAIDPQKEAKEELENLKKQHDLLKRMLQQQEELRALQGRQAALLSLQHKAEHAIAAMDESVVTETTGSLSGVSLTSELNEELNDLIQRFHNQLHDSQPVPDNRRQAASLSLTREVSQSRNSSLSEPMSEEKAHIFNKMKVLKEKKLKMDKLLGELHTLRNHHLNNSSLVATSGSPQRSLAQSANSIASATVAATHNAESNSWTPAAYPPVSTNQSEDEECINPTEKLKKLKEVRKRLNELRELVHYYEQTSDMMTDAVNENNNDDEETEESEYESSEQENPQPATNIRNPQRIGSWVEVNSNSNAQCIANNRDGRPLNTDCEINNRAAANIRTLNMASPLDCLYNRDDADDKDGYGTQVVDDNEDEDEDEVNDQASEVSESSQRSSIVDNKAPVDAEFEQKFNRLVAAKHKLRQLQDLVALVQDGDDAENCAGNGSNSVVTEDEEPQPNNVRHSVRKTQRDVALNEKARQKFYEAKLEQQQKELKQLHEERKKLIDIQEKIQELQKACPDLQLSTSSTRNVQASRQVPVASSTPADNADSEIILQTMPDPEDSEAVDTELWAEIRRHQILREELRQRRKQLEALMAEHQKRRGLPSNAAASIRSDGSETLGTQPYSRTEKTMATWGGSTQCALDEDIDEEDYPSDGINAEEEEEELGKLSNENFSLHPQSNMNRNEHTAKGKKDRWQSQRPFSADGNYRPSNKTRQQQNISMRRQENHRWVSELSYVEEKEQWQEQINHLRKQLEFSTNICQTLMQDQQTLSYLLQNLLTSPYSVMPSNVGSPQVHLIMHQLNQCYTQLTWQQNNVQRLKQMLNDLMRQQQEHQHLEKSQGKDQSCNAPPPSSPTVFCPFNFTSQPMNFYNMPSFAQFPALTPGMHFNSAYPSGFADFSQSSVQQRCDQQLPHDHNISGKTEYLAFPKPFESTSSNGTEKERNPQLSADGMETTSQTFTHSAPERATEKQNIRNIFSVPVQCIASSNNKITSDGSRPRMHDEESLESFSSMPDPVDPTPVTKTIKSRKAVVKSCLPSAEKNPKMKNKKRKISHLKSKMGKNIGLEKDAAICSSFEPFQCKNLRAQSVEITEDNGRQNNPDQMEKSVKYNRSTEMSSETGSDFSMFEALRDTIYSEVATLISQNEPRPHFLIELFHELQLLNTDYLRQRALYALQDIVTRHIPENSEKEEEEGDKALNSAAWVASNSELTPSESLDTDDDTFEKTVDGRDYREHEQHEADNTSMLSTSSNFEPFATDDLGNTVIHLDQALARMREYERMKIESESMMDSEGYCIDDAGATAADLEVPSCSGEDHSVQHPVEECISVPCPRIDTQQLDRQIKAIMKEVIPFLKEHMEHICSAQLLTSIRRMVLTLTQQNDESKEFVKFFHKQLGSILQDSLSKFAGRKLKDCGEDLLVEISEVLFNELAFFRLMQDLDSNSISSVDHRCEGKMEKAGILQYSTKEVKGNLALDGDSDVGDIFDEDKDKDETEAVKQVESCEMFDQIEIVSVKSDTSEHEEDDESECLPVTISLSKAETQALTNYGSGEDENEEEVEFEEGPVEVQTSLQANKETIDENEQKRYLVEEVETEDLRPGIPPKTALVEGENKIPGDESRKSFNAEHVPSELHNNNLPTSICKVEVGSDYPLTEENAGQTCNLHNDQAKSLSESSETSITGSPNTESPVLVNEYETGSGNQSQKSDEDDFVKVEDLPLKLTVSESDLMKKMVEEEHSNSLCGEILAKSNDGTISDQLAGNPEALKEPDTSSAQSE
ncbi:pericentriolar material 1 protein isoform X3 [Ambystoma mexicanum]|uniref:pericentriolar material 1 protein isoform X3 n=1 Tax=Ambystoma mexicanum TaxID=8296 RepID=UPI0037E8F039